MEFHLRCVLFDLDGTLVDTIQDIADSVNKILSKYDFPLHDVAEYKMMVGEGFRTLMRRALPELVASDADFVNKLTAEASSLYRLHSLEKSKPFPGVLDLLSELTRRNYVLAVLSNKPDLLTKHIVSAFFGSFDFLKVLGESPEWPKKPDPTSAAAIARLSAIDTAMWGYVGDSKTDMQTAVAAGMVPFGAAWGYRTEKELVEFGSRCILRSPLELLDHLPS